MNRIKMPFLALIIVIFLSTGIFAQDAGGTKFMLGFDFGLGYAKNDDLNDGTKDFGPVVRDQYKTKYPSYNWYYKHDKAGLAWGTDLEARILGDTLGMGLSIGYHSAGKAKNSVKAEGYTAEHYYSAEITAIPILATLYYKVNMANDNFFLLGAGGGYYKGQLTVTEEAKNFADGNFKNDFRADGSTWGVHAKAEFDFVFSQVVSFFVGLNVRYAKIDEFKYNGSTVIITSTGKKVEGNFTGFLMYFGAGLIF